MLQKWLELRITAGIDLDFADSGEVLQRGMADSGRLKPPLLDSTLQEILGVEVDLWATQRNLGWPITMATEHDQS
jgi:hypothetical protein